MSTPRDLRSVPPPELRRSPAELAAAGFGNAHGTGIRGAVEHFVQKYGPSASHAVIARLGPSAQKYLTPNAPVLGILGTRKYPYPFCGELIRAMAAVVRADEDAFIRELAFAGVDATTNTVARVALRYVLKPADVAERSQELWNIFHDSGRITITDMTDREWLSHLTEWPNHDLTMCKLGVQAAVRIVEKTGVRCVEARREKCIAWGHDYCLTRMRWTP
jgi:hypothetical protein